MSSDRYLRPYRPAVFLDRDGTINKQVGYINTPEKIELLPGAAQAVARINALGYWCLVVTNQSAIARGLATEDEVRRVNAEVALQIAKASGGRVDAFYYCPHHESEGDSDFTMDCDCRKPGPGMILKGAEEFNVDLKHSWLVGDGVIDHEAAKAASEDIRTILVPSRFHDGDGVADYHEESLWDAVGRIAVVDDVYSR